MFLDARKAEKRIDEEVTTPVSYMTGFMNLDYINGFRVKVFENDDDNDPTEGYDSVGFVGGTVVMIISDSGLGKTTFTQQAAVQIVSQFENSFVIHEDIEKSSIIDRVYNITNKNPRWIKTHYKLYQDAHAETFAERFIAHAKMKLNNRKEFEYDTGLKDIYGSKLKALAPTVVILDSLAVLRSEDASIMAEDKAKDGIEDVTGNMQGARKQMRGNIRNYILH